MNLEDYLNHLREKEGKKMREELSEENSDKDGDEESTIDEAIIKIKNLINLKDNNIKYDLEF